MDWRLQAGQQLVVRGANGVGKTTLLRVLAGLTRADTGEILLDGSSCPDGLRGNCCYAGHAPAVHGDLTVVENLRFWGSLSRGGMQWREALAAVGLERQAQLDVRRLSAGQRRRAGFARVLMSAARVWLLDEPCTHLDQRGREIVTTALDAHCRAGGIVVVASHDPLPAGDRQASELLIGAGMKDG